MSDPFRIVAYLQQPELGENIAALEAESFPRYIEEDVVWAEVSPGFYDEFGEFQFFVMDDDKHQLAGLCNSVPFTWDGVADHLPGYHQMLKTALSDWRAGKKPNTFSVVQAIINPEYRGQGVPELIFDEAKRLAREHGMTSIMTALRPTLKDRYPLVEIDEYANWRREDGQLFDPWLRAVERIGGELIRPEAESAIFEASITDWESWTGMKFPASGEYWLPEALSTLHIDRKSNTGRHCEPHVWFRLSVD